MTPHINAKQGEIAKKVLMPGDPLRAKYIAETYLEDAKLVSDVRNMFMYTGTYKGKKVTIAGSGMGQASMGIYSFELFKFYDVDSIIRIGSCGAYKKDIKLYDVILASSAYSDSLAFPKLVLNNEKHVSYPTKELNDQIKETASKLDIKIHEARVHSSDVFYSNRDLEETIQETESDVVEMEAGALFANAKFLNKKAATILTVSDNLITKELTSSEERQTAFNTMMELALEAC